MAGFFLRPLWAVRTAAGACCLRAVATTRLFSGGGAVAAAGRGAGAAPAPDEFTAPALAAAPAAASAAALPASTAALTANYAASLTRFVDAQERVATYGDALGELRAGAKESHWMWYVFPQLAALGRSHTAVYFGLAGAAHARAYLAHAVLGPRLREAAGAALAAAKLGRSARELMGYPDDMKLRSCMTLFEAAAGSGSDDARIFAALLDALYDGQRDVLTLDLLAREAGSESGDEAGGGLLPAAAAAAAATAAAAAATAAAATAAAVADDDDDDDDDDAHAAEVATAASVGGRRRGGKR